MSSCFRKFSKNSSRQDKNEGDPKDPKMPRRYWSGPPRRVIIGNIPDLMGLEKLTALVEKYNYLLRAFVFKRPLHFIGDAELAQELLESEDRFTKDVMQSPVFVELRRVAVGLFTTSDSEKKWQVSHRILVPAFSQSSMSNYFPKILDVTTRFMTMLEKERISGSFDIPMFMTKLTMEAISACAFSHQFGEFDHPRELHPFFDAMTGALRDTQLRGQMGILHKINISQAKKSQAQIEYMAEYASKIISARREEFERTKVDNYGDVLSIMFTASDPVTGEKLSDEQIVGEVVTFLVAGHETTSGLLSFTLYELARAPHVLRKVIEEVDGVFGRDPSVSPTFSQVQKLKYTMQVLKESLRLHSPAPGFFKAATCDTTLGGDLPLKTGDNVIIILPALHTNPLYWGPNAKEFNPDNFTPEAEAARHPYAWLPFNSGNRSCIGLSFALLEARLVLGMLLQRFIPHFVQPYKLEIIETLTQKPKDLHMVLLPRDIAAGGSGSEVTVSPQSSVSASLTATPQSPVESLQDFAAPTKINAPICVAFGSNMGSSEAFARELVKKLSPFSDSDRSVTLLSLDELCDFSKLPVGGLLVVVTSTYNGFPPDNAKKFANLMWTPKWSEEEKEKLSTMRYAVFGCGNSQWKTFQKFPRAVDSALESWGATRILDRGEADADGEFSDSCAAWASLLPGAVSSAFGVAHGVDELDHGTHYDVEYVEDLSAAPSVLPPHPQASPIGLLSNTELLSPSASSPDPDRSTRHIEFAFDPAVTPYAAGDHLAICPENNQSEVSRLADLLRLSLDARVVLTFRGSGAPNLPVGTPLSISTLLSRHLDIMTPPTRRAMLVLAKHTPCPPEKRRLEALGSDFVGQDGSDAYSSYVAVPKRTLAELLNEFRSVQLPLAVLLDILPTLKPRYYSISSSPLSDSSKLSITVAVAKATTSTGRLHLGVCSTFLANLSAGSQVFGFTKCAQSSFHLPKDPLRPLIMIGPGTGLAPFRGALQERKALQDQGQQLGPALLFFGCRTEEDFIYRQELESFERDGVLSKLHVAFSRVPGLPKTYVQHKVWEERTAVWDLIQKGATVLVCGDAKVMAPDVRQAFANVAVAEGSHTEESAAQFVSGLVEGGRYVEDVWAST